MTQAVRDIGSRRQLLLDDYVIASTRNLKRTFHRARKHGEPVMVPEHPWEGVGTAPWPSVLMFGDVIWDDDEQQYRMWYTTCTKDMEGGQHDTLYATSEDGIRWHKPLDLNIVEYEGSGANNLLVKHASAQTVLRVDEEIDPAKRYRLLTFDRNVHAYVWRYSADGLRWSEPVRIPALAGKGMFDNLNGAYDATGEDTEGTKSYACVEMLDADGNAIEGYAQSDCDPIHVNSVNHTVTWNGNRDVSGLAGRDIRVGIALRGAELYAFQFAD